MTKMNWKKKAHPYVEALFGGLGGAVAGLAFFIVFAAVTYYFELGQTGLLFMALYAGGCGGFMFGRHAQQHEQEQLQGKIDPER